MKKTMLLAAMAALLAGCDQSKTEATKTDCFSIISGNTTQPYAPLMVNNCTGESWLLVRSRKGEKPEDGYTYQWFKLDKIDMWPPSLVDK